jgi:hypothetical protein
MSAHGWQVQADIIHGITIGCLFWLCLNTKALSGSHTRKVAERSC